MSRPRPSSVAVGLLLAFVYLPIVVVIVYAFNSGSNLSWPPEGVSLRWFRVIFGEDGFTTGLTNSVKAAILTSLVAVFTGSLAAFAITRRPSRLGRSLESGARLPVMLPPLFIGLGLAVSMKTFTIDPSLATIVLGHVIVTTPFVVLVVAARLRDYDIRVEEAARDLGATPAMVLRRITLPLIAPAVLGSMVIAAAISFDEILITNFTSGTTGTLPIFVISRLRRTIDPSVNAVAVVLLVIPWLTLALFMLIQSRRRATAVKLDEMVTA